LKHVVVAGENLAIIARKYGVSVAALMAANNIKDGDVIRVGQELVIPAGVTPSPTAPKATETPTATAPSTLAPTLTVTATTGAAGAPTAAVAATATFVFAAPSLLTPPNNAIIKGAEDILLNWTSVGLLDDNTWYVVSIRREDQGEPSLGWTRTTAWRFPASEFPGTGAASNRFYWSVTVMRAVEGSAPEALSPQSEERVFVWE
jgi:murein DD-endopeptidase MepM/ murein hydrolase activator NlpD